MVKIHKDTSNVDISKASEASLRMEEQGQELNAVEEEHTDGGDSSEQQQGGDSAKNDGVNADDGNQAGNLANEGFGDADIQEGAAGGVDEAPEGRAVGEMGAAAVQEQVEIQFQLLIEALRRITGIKDDEIFTEAIANLDIDPIDFGQAIDSILHANYPRFDMDPSSYVISQIYAEDIMELFISLKDKDDGLTEAFRIIFLRFPPDGQGRGVGN